MRVILEMNLQPAPPFWRWWRSHFRGIAFGMLVSLVIAGAARPVRGDLTDSAAAFANFDAWWQQYVAAAAADRPALGKKGAALAKIRRDAMVQLIEADPATAIQKAFFEEYHSALPQPIQELVELHVRGLATLRVVKAKDGAVQRRVKMEQGEWKAFLYGPRLELGSRQEIPIHGVVLAGRIAVDGSPLERFPDRESLLKVLGESEGRKICPIGGEPGTIPGAVGDVLLWFDTEEHRVICEKALIEKEVSPEAVE